MDAEQLIAEVRAGMAVITADGKKLGKVRRVHTRETEAYVEVVGRGALWTIMEPKARFLPGSAVVAAVDGRIHLNMDVRTAKGCTVRPRWIEQEIQTPNPSAGFGQGSA